MKALNKTFFTFITIFILQLFGITIIAQENFSEGFSEFSIKYFPKETGLKTKDLMKTYGDTERVYWTKIKFKRFLLFKEDTLRVNFTNHLDKFKCVKIKVDPFYYTREYSNDSNIHFTKLDSNVLINNILCDIYADSSRKITAYIIKDKPIKFGYVSNYRDLVKVEIENDNFTVVKEIKKHESNIDTLHVFQINKDKIVRYFDDISNMDSIKLQLNLFTSSFNKMNKFPNYFLLNYLEGQLKLNFIINNKGKPVNPRIFPVYYQDIISNEKISNKRKINRITRKIEKNIIKYFSESIASIEFDIPISNGEPTNFGVSFPIKYFQYYD